MAFDYITEAFKRLDVLEEDIFKTSTDGISALTDFIENDDDEVIDIIDPKATTEEEISDSYVGKVIVNCNVCHSHIFENKDDIVIDEDGAVNAEEACPYCGESEGFTIIGEIAPFEKEFSEEEEQSEDKENDSELTEALGIGAGLALGGAAIGAGMVGSKLFDSVEEDDDVETLTEEDVDEGLLGDINLNIDGSKSSVGFLGGSPSTTNEEIEDEECSRATKRAMKNTSTNSVVEGKVTMSKDQLAKLDKAVADARAQVAKYPIKETQTNTGDVEPDFSEVEEKDLAAAKRAYDNYKKAVKAAPDRSKDELIITENLTEGVNNVSVETDDSLVNVSSDENGKVTVTTEPINSEVTEETIVPVSDETTEAILDNNEVEPTADEIEPDISIEETSDEETPDEEAPIFEESLENEHDIEFDDVDEDGLNHLAESYLKNVYENVKSFKTTDISCTPTQMIVEGVINFHSGSSKKTGFVFEAHDINSRGQVRFIGTNKQLAESEKAFTLVGSVDNKKLFTESLKYQYCVNEQPVRGVVRRK